MLLAFLKTCFTYVGAEAGVLLVEFGVTRAQPGALVCDIGSIPAETDAACQVVVPGFDTLVCTPIADLSYFEARVYAFLHLVADVEVFGSHGFDPHDAIPLQPL